MDIQYLNIKNKEIPIIIREYKTSKTIKMYFKNGIFTITKPKYVSKIQIDNMIRNSEDKIYENYIKVLQEKKEIKKWYEKENILYKGEELEIILSYTNNNNIRVKMDIVQKILRITIPSIIQEDEKEEYLNKAIKQLLKNNTQAMLQDKLPYWSNITGIKYNTVKVRDGISKFGSCKPKTQDLNFNARLIMLPENVVDAIIVHELCHIIHANHSKEFYNLVEKYIPNYYKINKWLKQNGNKILL